MKKKVPMYQKMIQKIITPTINELLEITHQYYITNVDVNISYEDYSKEILNLMKVGKKENEN